MSSRSILSAVLLLLAACATGGATGAGAESKAHTLSSQLAGADRKAYEKAEAHEAKGDDAAPTAIDQARGEWAAAAAGYAALAERPAADAWRVPLRTRAAELFLSAQRWEEAARSAEAVVSDAQANDAARATAARLAATARLGAANAAVRAGQLEKLELSGDRKEGSRPPPEPWKRVVESTDAYLSRAEADPDPRPAAEPRNGVGAAELALVAAEVQYAYGDMEDARRRFHAVLERWPSDPQVLAQAVPLYLSTFVVRGDRAGHDAAVQWLRDHLGAHAAKASAPAEKAAFAKALDGLSRSRAEAGFAAAERMLAQGKPEDAARAFEAVAAEPGAIDPANALHNAAVAWDQAKDAARAAGIRERILKEHPDARVTADAAFRLAAFHAKKRDHLRAARAYDELLRRWPDSPNRCLALRNAASELDRAQSPDAATRYLAFGTDPACAKADPNVAARALVRAGRLFESQAKAAYDGAAGLQGVTDANAKAEVVDAKQRLKAP